jgi:hypothetical protein
MTPAFRHNAESDDLFRSGIVKTFATCGIALAGALVAAASVCWGALAAADPSTYVYDAPTAKTAEPFPARMPAEKSGWTRVPEGDLAHEFAGRAVLLNHAVRLVLARGAPGAALYARRDDGFRRGAVLVPRPSATNGVPACIALRLREDTRGAVAVAADFRYPDGTTASGLFRLTAGARAVEVRAAEGAARLGVQADASHAIVPDFFAGDVLVDAEAARRASSRAGGRDRLAVPAENCILAHAGDALLMGVWRSGAQHADLVLARATGGEPGIAGFEVECAAERPVWVAPLEAPGICERLRVAAGKTAAETVAAWAPPFPAKWRAGRPGADAAAETWDLAAAPLPAWATRVGSGNVLVYPIDRSRDTPLTVLCPVDVLRDVLGVGPCRYILDAEGLGTEGGSTPAEVMPWIERQFSRGRDGRRADQIRQRLRAMTDHLARTATRIEQYAQWAEQVRALAPADGAATAGGPVQRMVRILNDLRQDLADGEDALTAPALAGPMVDQIAALIGRDGAAGEVQRLGERLRDLGASRDRTLARCRMAARRLEAWARMAGGAPDVADLAAAVRSQAEAMLRGKETAP